ncbi:MAG: diguanylate cyclase [Thermaerobacter sp.]|nr:diguanylate cyclase [Thermaerobacter sp.]
MDSDIRSRPTVTGVKRGQLLNWNDGMRTGLETVDAEHQHLFAIFNALYRIRGHGHDAPELQRLMQELARYTRYHFRTEADLMHRWAVSAPHQQQHFKAHREFRRHVNRATALASSAPADVVDALLPFLAQWILYHIMGMDAALAREIHALQAGEAATVPLIATDSLHDQMLALITRLNNQLAERAFDVLLEKRQWENQALQDDLTGLPNRLALYQHLSREIARIHRAGGVIAVGMMDIDDFKSVNDTWGHAAGDRLLHATAVRLQSATRAADFVARLGGDEFVVVLQDLKEGPSLLGNIATSFDRIQQAFEAPFQIASEVPIAVRFSIGVAVFPGDAEDLETLVQRADQAMYYAKQHKHRTPRAWLRLTPDAGLPAGAVDAYDEHAQALLYALRPMVDSVIGNFVEQFYRLLAADRSAQSVLAWLSSAERERLEAQQAAYWRYWLKPDARRQFLRERASQVGRIHFLAGVPVALLIKAGDLFRRLLLQVLIGQPLSLDQRYRFLQIIDGRLSDDLEAQLQETTDVMMAYTGILGQPLPPPGMPWQVAARMEGERVAALPGILDVALYCRGSDGNFQIEGFGGPLTQYWHATGSGGVRDPGINSGTCSPAPPVPLEPSLPPSLTISSYAPEPKLPWHSALVSLGVRSDLAIPMVDEQGRTVAGLRCFGSYPQQFQSPVLGAFAQGLEVRLREVWRRAQ